MRTALLKSQRLPYVRRAQFNTLAASEAAQFRLGPGDGSLRERVKRHIAIIDASSQATLPPLYDTFHRQHDYLRISLTERCNLRCFYCMPSDGIELTPHARLLTTEEVLRLAELFVKCGVRKIRLTGGEPTVRKDIIEIVGQLSKLRKHGLEAVGVTSNGIALHRKLPELVDNGLTHLNLSLDTLDPFKFEIMTRRRGHDAVLRSLETALTLRDLQSVKLNVVVIKGLNDSEVPDFIELTRERNMSVRFIEFMPFTGNKWEKTKIKSSSELLGEITSRFGPPSKVVDAPNDTARTFRLPGFQGSFGFISSMSDHFCSTCNRVRLTADGQIKVCLFDPKEVSLRDAIRQGASDDDLLGIIRRAVNMKKEKHAGMENIDVVNNREMIRIGALMMPPRRPITFNGVPKSLSPLNRTGIPLPPRSFAHPMTSGVYARSFSVATSGDAPAETYSSRRLTHVDTEGRASMVDVSDKRITQRSAIASGRIYVPRLAFDLIQAPDSIVPETRASAQAIQKARSKGSVLTVSQLAGIMASKKTSELIPLCHPLPLTHVGVELTLEEAPESGELCSIVCQATASCDGKTGVEMEALTAVSVSLLTVWDMLKAIAGQHMRISDIKVVHKEGGKSDFKISE